MTSFRPLTVIKALRVHQWPKNLLLFVPITMAHRIGNIYLLYDCCVAFLAFCAAASGMYIINDLRDRESDRVHVTKRFRPIASGEISVSSAALLSFAMLAIASILAYPLPLKFQEYLLLYALSSLLYSCLLKQLLVFDIIALALLYTLRILAGGAAVGIPVSHWLMSFALFIFTSLACLKRFSELRRLKSEKQSGPLGRGYLTEDTETVSMLGGSAGYISVLILVLFINSAEITILYTNHRVLWLLTPLALYWVTRMWILAARGIVDEDPLVFALRDWTNYLVGGVAAAVVYLAR